MENIPQLGLGTWKIAKNIAEKVVYEAIRDLGIRHFDCACDYGNEVEVGNGIKKAIEEGIVKREDLWVTSKLWNTFHKAEHVELACRKTLTDLQLEYVDAYLIHFPIALKFVPIEVRYPPEWIHDPTAANPRMELEPSAPVHETWKAMEQLVDLGLTKRIGVCNFTVQLLMDLLSYARIPPFLNQVELHPYLVQPVLVDYCKSRNIHCTGYSPLGSGSYVELGGDRGLGKGVLECTTVTDIAAKYNRSAAQVVLRWGVQRGCSVIPKSSSKDRMKENTAIFDFELTEEEMNAISGLDRNMRFNDPGVYGKFMGAFIPIFN